jgi:D-glycero-D-manno-heptose 1,7-bisphosphate phosphatase
MAITTINAELMKLLILDLDGTVRRTKSGATFINTPEDQEIIPEAAAAIALYVKDGWTIVGATNQGGVASGKKTLQDAIVEQEITLKLVSQLEYILFCPDFEGRQCYCVSPHRTVAVHEHWKKYSRFIGEYRKPNPGMILLAHERLNSGYSQPGNTSESLMVGDRDEDKAAAVAGGIRFLWNHEWYGEGDRF